MKLNKYIDHTLLRPCTEQQLINLCDEAIKYDFASVCILPANVAFVKDYLKNSNVKVCSVVGFPLGENTTQAKIFEAKELCDLGADELDIVINLSWGVAGYWDKVAQELKEIVAAVKPYAVVKVIIESCMWNEKQLVLATNAVLESCAGYIKTSTGFSFSGATLEAVHIIKKTIGQQKLLIKASGGIRTREQAIFFVEAGATRIGTSNGIAICDC